MADIKPRNRSRRVAFLRFLITESIPKQQL